MDRQTIYSQALPRSLDFLTNEQNTMVAVAKLAEIVMGTSAVIGGLGCTPTGPASLAVVLGSGQILQTTSLEATNWSSLTADTTHQILKQGIALDAQNIGITPPATGGFSQVFLIEVQYADLDTSATVLPYFNNASPFPQPPLNGPGGSGVAQNTVRKGIVSVQVKAGVAATTGTQVAPTADAGWVGLWNITVANGQTTITSGNIVQVAGAPFLNSKLPQIPGMIQTGVPALGIDTGVANAMVAAFTPPITALVDGMMVRVRVKVNNSGATTLDVGPGPVSVRQGDTSILANGDLLANQMAWFSYDAALTVWQLLRAGESSKANTLIAGPIVVPTATATNPGPATNLQVTNDGTNPTRDIATAPGQVRDTTGVADLAINTSIIKRLDQSFVPGTNAGAFDTGSKGIGQTINIFIIGRLGVSVTSRARLSNTATLIVPSHGLGVGNTIRVYGVGGGYDGIQTIASVIDANTFTFANNGSNESAVAIAGALQGYDVLASLSLTPALPSGWTVSQFLWSVLTDGTAAVYGYIVIKNKCVWLAASQNYTSTIDSTNRVATMQVPSGRRTVVSINGYETGINNGYLSHFYCPDITNPTITADRGPASTGSENNTGSMTKQHIPTQDVVTNTSGQIGFKALTSATAFIFTLGYTDPLRNAY